MKILITGGAGYIGSILTLRLLEKKYSVHVVDNFLYKQNSLSIACKYKNFSVEKTDVRNFDLLKNLYSKFVVIIPLAALVGAPICAQDPVSATHVNKTSVIEMVKSLSKDQYILMPITNSGYGIGQKNVIYNETAPLNPISLYGKDKVEVENFIMSRDNSISFRLATVFGMSPRMRIDLLVNDFVHRALIDKTLVLYESSFVRNFIHVDDVADVFIYAIENLKKMNNEIYNVGLSNANLSKLQLALKIKKFIPDLNIIESQTGKDPDQRNYIVSNEKIEKTGYKPIKSVEDGIVELIKGYKTINNNVYGNV